MPPLPPPAPRPPATAGPAGHPPSLLLHGPLLYRRYFLLLQEVQALDSRGGGGQARASGGLWGAGIGEGRKNYVILVLVVSDEKEARS